MGKSISFILIIIFCSLSGVTFAEENPAVKEQILKKMEDFCKKAGGIVALFENSCANSCIIYNRQSGKNLDPMPSQCQKKKIYSCACPEKQCLKDGECQNIIIG